MCVDITKAVHNNDLLFNSTIAVQAQFFAELPSGQLKENLIYGHDTVELCVNYTPRAGVTNVPVSRIKWVFGNVVESSAIKYDSRNLVRHVPLDYFFVPAPYVYPGANGIKILRTNHNYFLCSGALTGCSCFFGELNDYIFFVHSGCLSIGAEGIILDKEKRREVILKDLFVSTIRLFDSTYNIEAEQMSIVEVSEKLSEYGFKGTLVTESETSSFFFSENKNIAVVNYNITNEGCNMAAYDVIAIVNERGFCSTGIRRHIKCEASSQWEVDSAYDFTI